MDLNKLPKQFCENITIGYSREYLALALLSGQNIATFALTPEHAKRLLMSLTHNIEAYEKNFGEIKTTWIPGVESPLQIADITSKKDTRKK